MDIETIKALSDLPLVFVLIYIIIKQQAQITALLERIGSNERTYTENIMRLVIGGYSLHDYPGGAGENQKT